MKKIVLGMIFCLCLMSSGTGKADEGDAKSPGLAFVLSLVLPAGGQYYNGDVGKGVILDLGMGAGVVMALAGAADQSNNAKNQPVGVPYSPSVNDPLVEVGIGVGLGFYVVSLFDAPASSDTINRKSREKADMLEMGDNPRYAWGFNVAPLGDGADSRNIPAANAAFHF